ncbi:putative disease resistance protein RGA4 [Quercus lobata]|uniref:putative disease resistance protein RGA4 n=1 Tax=Quercus lobata TaxID=97700 RepID=UPI001244A6A3|nr:putative disease resistance protein RGA4 [Quercus lobata]
MDEPILSSVAGSIIENLGSAAFEQVGSLWNVEDDLEQIRKTVSTIKAVLQDAAEEQNHNHQDRVWLEKLKEAVFDADDLLDESKYHTELALRQKETSGSFIEKVRYFLSSISVVLGRPKMSLKISKLSQELDAIAKDREKFHWKERSTVKRNVIPDRETRPWFPHNEVIGREDEKNQIINRLLEPNNEENVLVVAIVGIAGIGKTTLAQCVYNDDRVDTQFELKIWACVSNVFEVTTFAKKLIMGIDKDDSMELMREKRRKINPEEVLKMDPLRELHDKISQKKILIVWDDSWNENCKVLNNFIGLLSSCAKECKIVITTRDKFVVDITRANETYFLKGLSEDYSWSLFEKLAFRNRQDTKNPTLVDFGREIVGKCQGVPLVIKSIGNVLYSKKPNEWSKIRDKVVANVIEQGGDNFPILRLSYDNLPSYLKCCFAFCSLFPKNYEIDKMTVIQLWMAHGFVQLPNDDTQQVEGVVDEYFKDLHCNFFEEVRDRWGALKYKMHDLYHDLALLIVGANCRLDYLDGITRHVSFSSVSSFTKTLSLVKASSKVRTILFTHSKNASDAMDESTLSTLIEIFPSLRALDLHGLKIEIMKNSLGKLIHLKYLDLSFNPIKTLPDSITSLLNLQTLKLQDCRNLKQLPRDITKLVSLRHLDDRGCFKLRLPQGLRKLTGLQSLPLFNVRNNGELGELNGLNNLRGTLKIQILEQLEDANLDYEVKNLKKKQHLEKLELAWAHQEGHDEMLLDSLQPHPNLKILEVCGYTGVTFSSWLSSIKNLVKITLRRCDSCNHLPPLSELPFLESLWLDEMKDLECISDRDISEEVSTLSFFPSLKSLWIMECPNLKGWWRSASMTDHQQHQHNRSLPSFPCLSYFWICNCPNMTSMPLFPYLGEVLRLTNVSSKLFQETILPSSSSSSSSHLSKLISMYILNLPDVVSLPDGLVSNLISLERLYISNCKELNLGSDVDGMEWRHLNRLTHLYFSGLPKLNSLPVGLQHVTTLETLFIRNCENLKTLPRWIGNLISLKQFTIYNCLNLKTLPDEMRDLSSLQKLEIRRCPELQRRCEKETGQDWDKIAHIALDPDGCAVLKSLHEKCLAQVLNSSNEL